MAGLVSIPAALLFFIVSSFIYLTTPGTFSDSLSVQYSLSESIPMGGGLLEFLDGGPVGALAAWTPAGSSVRPLLVNLPNGGPWGAS